MQSNHWISGVALVLTAGLSVQTATAGPQEDVAAAAEKWTTVFAENNPDTIVALYSKDGCCGARFHRRYDRTPPR